MSLADLNRKLGKNKSAAAKIKAHTEAQEKSGRIARARKESAPSYIAKVVKKTASIAELLTEDDQLENLRVIREAKRAVHRVFDFEAKKTVFVPDTKQRLAAVMLDLAYREGTPVQRQLQLQGSFKDLSSIMEDMAKSPEGQRALKAMGETIEVEASASESLQIGQNVVTGGPSA